MAGSMVGSTAVCMDDRADETIGGSIDGRMVVSMVCKDRLLARIVPFFHSTMPPNTCIECHHIVPHSWRYQQEPLRRSHLSRI